MAGSKDESERGPTRRAGSSGRRVKHWRYDEYASVDPFRPVWWRWQRAQSLAGGDKPISRKMDDSPTCRTAKFLQRRARCKTDQQRAALADKFADIAIAQQIYERGREVRWLIEAQLLAGVTAAQVAKSSGTSEAAVNTYEQLFFHVSDRLDAHGYIATTVFGRKLLYREWTLDDKDVLLKWFAFMGGPVALAAVTPFVLRPEMHLEALSPEHQVLGSKVRRLLATMTMRIKVPKSKKGSVQSEPMTVEETETLIGECSAKCRAILRRKNRAITPSEMATGSVVPEVEAPLGCSASGGE